MPQIYDMGPTALLPLPRKACWGFFRHKNPTASAGFEPANLGTKGQHATPSLPKPFLKIQAVYFSKNLGSYIFSLYQICYDRAAECANCNTSNISGYFWRTHKNFTSPWPRHWKVVSDQQHAPAALCTRERPDTHFTGGWVGPRAGLDGRKILSPPGFDPGPSSP
jgi:hypothetical protein